MKIRDIAEINEESISKKYKFSEIEYIDTSSITNGIINQVQKLRRSNAPSRAKRIVKHNDIIISTVRPNLKHFGIIKNPKPNTIVSTGFAVITPKKVLPEYLFRYLTTNSYTNYLSIIAESQQSNYPAFNPSLIENTEIILPPLPIQKKIAAVLSAYDDLIENNNRRIEILEKMAEEIYKEWFVRMRFPGHENTKFVKGVPEGWEVKKLNDILTLQYGKSLTESDRTGEGFPVYGSSGIVGLHKKYLVKGPAVIVGRKGNVGKIHFCFENCYPIDTVYFVETTQPLLYIYYLLHNMNFINNDAAVPGLNRNQAYSNKFYLPKMDLIDEFSNKVKPIFDYNKLLNSNNQTLKQTQDRLLPRLISGKLSVEELNIKFPRSMRISKTSDCP